MIGIVYIVLPAIIIIAIIVSQCVTICKNRKRARWLDEACYKVAMKHAAKQKAKMGDI